MRPQSNHHRRGSMYVSILGVSLIVVVIGLSALLLMRIQNRIAGGATNFSHARQHALSAVDMGFFLIKQNPTTWRNDFATGGLPTNEPIGAGTYSLEATDPVDGDLTNNTTDPVLLTGIGREGEARFKLQVSLGGNGAPTPGTWRRVVD